jgi:hypothetical protein
MTYPIVPVLGITLSLTAIAGSVMAIPNYLPEREVKKLGNIDITSLWTSRPVSVDPNKQNFERLPALVVELPNSAEMSFGADNIVATETEPSMRIVRPGLTDERETAGVGLTSNYQADTAVVAWCTERYRSYRASDNSYQPYIGVRRECEPPFAASVYNPATNVGVEQAADIGDFRHTGDTHSQWCFARYRSYDPDNNTYRAFSGEIRACVSPFS